MALMASWDRILSLEPMDDKKPLTSTGLVDSRLFTGENKLHAIKNPQTCLWSLRYDSGLIPPALRGRFTSFKALTDRCQRYFETRNIKIKEIID